MDLSKFTEEKILNKFPTVEIRILVLGLPGSGKSTLARKISADLGIAHIETDRHFSLMQGQPHRREEFRQQIAEEIKRSSFVIEGHFKDLHDVIVPSVTHVIYLRASRWTLFRRNLQREWKKWVRECFGIFKVRFGSY